MINKISKILIDSIEVKQKLLNNKKILEVINLTVLAIENAFINGNKVLFCGNGGSAADAQHLAAEFSGRFYFDRKPLPSDALHCNSSYLTAVANDYGYEKIYSRILEGIGNEGDVLVGLSTSGNSENIIKAFEYAKNNKIITIGMTGKSGGKMKEFSDYLIDIQSIDTPRIQECHITVGHIICQLVEEKIYK